jgi:endoglucanase
LSKRMRKSPRKKRAVIVFYFTAVLLIVPISYFSIRLFELASYPDAKSKPRIESYLPETAHNVRRARNDMSGVNFGLALQGPKEGSWGVVLHKSDFDVAQQAGFHYIRVQVRFLSYLSKGEGGYQLDQKLLSRLDWIIKCILERHMIAIIDFYNLVPDEKFTFDSSTDREQNEETFLAVWRILSKRYRDYSGDLFFELANEPHRPITQDMWNEYVHEALVEIRGSGGNNRTRMIVVGVPVRIGRIIHTWDQVNGIEDLEIPSAETDPNIMITFHYYNPYAFTYQGQTYTQDLSAASRIWKGNYWTNSERQRSYVERDFAKIDAWAKANHRKIILGEFGASVYADFGSQVRWTSLVRQEAEYKHMVWIFWDFFSQDKLGSLYNQSTGAWRRPILEALAPSN